MTTSMSPASSRSPRSGLASRGQGQGVQGWKMNCLRPAPPTRSFFQADKRNTLRRKGMVCGGCCCIIVHVKKFQKLNKAAMRMTYKYCELSRLIASQSKDTLSPTQVGRKTFLNLNNFTSNNMKQKLINYV